eukprot:COSAG02_NODE_6538_length_3509_cov_31.003603_3_plen_169_part_00
MACALDFDRYLLLSGELEITHRDNLGLSHRLGFLSDGAFFGEGVAYDIVQAHACTHAPRPSTWYTEACEISCTAQGYEFKSHHSRAHVCLCDSLLGETPILDDSASAEIRRRTVVAVTDCKLCFIKKAKMVSSSQPLVTLCFFGDFDLPDNLFVCVRGRAGGTETTLS